MKIKYLLTPDEFVLMVNLHYSQYRKIKYIVYAILFSFLCFTHWKGVLNWEFLLMVFLPLVILELTLKYLLPFIYKIKFKKLKLLNTTREMEFLEDVFTVKTEYLDISIKYEAVEKVIHSKEFILLYMAKNTFHYLPIRAFENQNDMQSILDLLNQKIGR